MKNAIRNISCTLSMLALSSLAHSETIYNQDWEGSSLLIPTLSLHGGCYTKPSQSYNSFEFSNKYTRSGSQSIRVEVNGMDKNSVCTTSWLKDEAKSRSEIRHAFNAPDFHEIPHDKEIWFRTAYYFPSNEGSFASWWKESQRFILLQFMGGGNSSTPEIHFMIGNGGRIDIENASSTVETGESLTIRKKSVTIQPDKWVDIAVHWKRTWQSSGLVEIWIDGAKQVEWTGPSAIRNKPLAYIKQGIYFSTDLRDRRYVTYMDGTKIMGSNGNLAEMSFSLAPTPPEAPQSFFVE